MLWKLLLKVSGEGGREPRGQASLNGDDIEKDQPFADNFTYEWPVRHSLDRQVQGW